MAIQSLHKFKAHLDNDTRLYHPKWNLFTGSPIATFILQDVNYWWSLNWPGHTAGTPFYRKESEWLERLQITRDVFLSHRNKIGRQISVKDGELHTDVFAEGHLIAWLTGQDHKTHYWLNESLLDLKLTAVYFPESENPIRETVPESENPIRGIGKPDSDITEITTQITKEEERIEFPSLCQPEIPLTQTDQEQEDFDNIPIDENGDELEAPTKFSKDDAFFKSLMDTAGLPAYKLPGALKLNFEKTVLKPAHDDRDFKRWCFWVAEQFKAEAGSRTLNTYMNWVARDDHYQEWLLGLFVKKDDVAEAITDKTGKKVTKGFPKEVSSQPQPTTDEEYQEMRRKILEDMRR